MRPMSDTPTTVMLRVDDAPVWPVVDLDMAEQSRARCALHRPSPVTEPLLHRLLAGLRSL